jgi:ubiquinone/menaquinone biosynthesis C-methylase UbiE
MYTDDMSEWRELGGKHKAQNILRVCEGKTFSRVLECGAGEGSILKALDQSGSFQELYAVEISDSGIAQIRKRNLASLQEVKKFDGYKIPYPDDSFDLVYCSHVIEHVEHPRLLLRELKRVSKFQAFEIPLDYSIGADQNIQQFLSYGHISIYTPTVFRFLLRSEGYEILSALLTSTAQEVIRYNWYNNMGRKRSLLNELKVMAIPLRNTLKRILYGKRRHAEYGYSAYTCLARNVGDLKIF